MSPGADRDHRDAPSEGDAYVRQQLASIDGSLFNGMPVDDRYESGVPETQRGNSLDFIQMTGLTRPPLRQALHSIEGALAQTPIYDDLNPQGPLSFYEKGVADVDDTLGGDLLLGGLRDITLDADLIPNRNAEPLVVDGGTSRSAQAFRDIVAGLQHVEEVPDVEPPTDEESDGDAEPVAEPDEYEGSTSGALLALVEELESVMGVEADDEAESEAPADLHVEIDDEVASPPEEEASESVVEEAPQAAALSAPAAEIDDDDFDALLASLSGRAVEADPVGDGAHAEDHGLEEIDTPIEPEASSLDHEAPAAGAGISDDWDALLDSMTVRGSEPTPAPNPVPVAATPRMSQASGALAEAEQLMQALEKRTPIIAPTVPAPVAEQASSTEPPPGPMVKEELSLGGTLAPPTALDLRMRERVDNMPDTDMAPPLPADPEGDAAINYDYSAAPSRRRSRRHSRVARKGRKIVKAAFVLILLGGLTATLWTFVLGPMMLQDEDLAVRAEREMARKDYSAASQTYLQLASRMASGEKGRSDAEFRAALALTQGPATSWDETRQRYERALALFKKFTEDYPQHPKRTRALSIMGRLHYELKDFEQAIVVFRDQVKPADDPAASLSMLRYLARSYSMTGNYEQAETSYLQSATLPGNYSAESDYLELGDLFRRRAEAARDGAEQEKLKEMAMSYWRRAMQVPGIAPGDRSNLEKRLQWLSFAEQSGASATGGAAAPEASAAPAPPAPVETEAVVPAESAIPVPQDETGRAETPGAELDALVPPAPAVEAVPEAVSAPASEN